MSRVYWDSMLFVYMLEANPVFGPKVRIILNEMIRRGDVLCTSVFSVGEVLAGARKRGSQSLVDSINQFFASDSVQVLPFTLQTADRFSVVRSVVRVTQADAIHLATAAIAQTDVFLTNDLKLTRLQIPGIQFIVGLDGNIFAASTP